MNLSNVHVYKAVHHRTPEILLKRRLIAQVYSSKHMGGANTEFHCCELFFNNYGCSVLHKENMKVLKTILSKQLREYEQG